MFSNLFQAWPYSPLQCSHQVSLQSLWSPEKTAATWCSQCRYQARNCNVTGCLNLRISAPKRRRGKPQMRDAEGVLLDTAHSMRRRLRNICGAFVMAIGQPRPSSGCKWTGPDPGNPRNFGGVASHTCSKGRAQAPCAEHCIQTGCAATGSYRCCFSSWLVAREKSIHSAVVQGCTLDHAS